MNKYKIALQKVFSLADVKFNEKNPWDIKIHNENFYKSILASGSLALGETYMDGWWDCERLDEFFERVVKADLTGKVKDLKKIMFAVFKAKLVNLQKKSRAFNIGKKHYDAGNELYQNMLDKRMVYTCGYWKNAKNLDEAQEAKLDLVCRKIGLKKGMKVLDIGCGWGGFAKFAAEKYGAKVVGITVSKEQVKLAGNNCKGLDVEIRLQDYRDLNEKFDRIVSLGMFEHVGPKNYRIYMRIINKCLKEDGLFLIQTIGSKLDSDTDLWVHKYIFPDGVLPSAKQITTASEKLLVLEDWHNFGADYDKTLIAWHENFNKNWEKIKKNYDERFHRMWDYYLLSYAGYFRARKGQLWQIVFSKNGIRGGYNSIR